MDLPQLPTNQSERFSPEYSPYRDPSSIFFGMDENFIPTDKKPLQQPVCQHIDPEGHMCSKKAVLGSGYAGLKARCENHGGNGVEAKAKAKDILEAAKLMLTSNVPSALDNLVRLATDHSVAQNVQLAAIKDVLDRAGVKHDTTQKIEVEITQSPSEKIAEKLAKLRIASSEEVVEEENLEDMGER